MIDSPQVLTAEQALTNAVLIELAAARAYLLAHPAPKADATQRAWLVAALSTELAKIGLRCAIECQAVTS
jgi:hypothetical protein